MARNSNVTYYAILCVTSSTFPQAKGLYRYIVTHTENPSGPGFSVARNEQRCGWFHTGDVGRIDKEGFLYIVDRLKDMILSGGVNIYPKDIEYVIYTIPAVRDVEVLAAVYGVGLQDG